MITHQTEKYNWDFIFMGANIDVAEEGEKLGINVDHSFSFNASPVGLTNMYREAEFMCCKLRNA